MRRTARIAAMVLAVVSSAAHADHPLITEDTNVLGRGRSQVELHGELARDSAAQESFRRTHASATLAHGITDRLDLQLDLPWARLGHDSGEMRARQSGIEDVAVAAKWRFYEQGGLSAALKPELLLPTGRDEAGLGAGRAGWAAGLALGHEWPRVQLVAHLRYTARRNVVGDRQALRHASGAVLWRTGTALSLLLDYGRETSPEPADTQPARVVMYGALYALTKDLDVGIGIARGRSEPAEDRVVRAGIKLRW